MSLVYCHQCDKHIDTDYDAEHEHFCISCLSSDEEINNDEQLCNDCIREEGDPYHRFDVTGSFNGGEE